jgi:predicted aspartyl protease
MAKADRMGRVVVQVELANNEDLVRVKDGTLPPDKVRRVTLTGVPDTGATRLILPKKVVDQLGLPAAGKVKLRFADRRASTRDKVQNVWLRLQGREGIFDAAVEPRRDDVLIGAVVLETLDFVVDCTTQQLHPRDPKWIISECE